MSSIAGERIPQTPLQLEAGGGKGEQRELAEDAEHPPEQQGPGTVRGRAQPPHLPACSLPQMGLHWVRASTEHINLLGSALNLPVLMVLGVRPGRLPEALSAAGSSDAV